MEKIILIGAGGHCLSCIEVIESELDWSIAGLVDAHLSIGQNVCGYEILGNDSDLPSILPHIQSALITVGQLGSPDTRKRLFKNMREFGFIFPVIIASTAVVSKRASICRGSIIMHRAIINSSVQVGENCIINTNALLEHSVIIGDHCHISTGAIINGDCNIGDGCFIGSGAVIRNGISVCPGSIIGAGAIVVKDITVPGTYIGCPAMKRGDS